MTIKVEIKLSNNFKNINNLQRGRAGRGLIVSDRYFTFNLLLFSSRCSSYPPGSLNSGVRFLMRKTISWLIGITVWIALCFIFAIAGGAVGVPSEIDLDSPVTVIRGSGRYSYEDEVSSFMTWYGLTTMGLAIMGAAWAGQAFYHRRWLAGFSRRGWYSFAAGLMALSILAIFSMLLHLALGRFHGLFVHYIRMILELGALVGVGWFCRQWFRNRTKGLGHSDET